MRPPYESFPDASLQELPAPNGPVGPVAGPVVLDPLPEGAQGLVVLQVPDVVAEEDVTLLGHTEGVLELASASQSVPAEALRYPQRRRRVAPGAPDRVRPLPRDPHHAIVAAHVDGSVVDQEEVG